MFRSADSFSIFSESYNERSDYTCLFDGVLGACSKSKRLVVVCDKHCEVVFGFKIIIDRITSTYGTKPIAYMTPTQIKEGGFLPFPYRYDESTSKFCRTRNAMSTITAFTQSIPDINPHTSNRLCKILIQLFDRIGTNEEVCTVAPWTIFMHNANFNRIINNRFTNTTINAKSNDRFIQINAKSLPLFYKFLLYFVELSTYSKKRPSDNVDVIVSTLKENLLVNLDTESIEFINNIREDPIYIKTNTSEMSTPLVLSGNTTSNVESRFTRGMCDLQDYDVIDDCIYKNNE